MSKQVGKKKKAEANNAGNPATKNNGSGGAATDPRVAQQMRVQQVVGASSKGGQKEEQMYSPRTMNYVEQLHPILEYYQYSRMDIVKLIQRCQYDDAEIETTVANIVEDQKSSSQWGVVKGKKQIKEEKQLVEKEKKKEQEIQEGVMQAMAEFESRHACRAQILGIESQDTKQGGALVLVTGCLSWEGAEANGSGSDTKNRHFARAFYVDHKAEPSEGYSVLNDIQKFMCADGDDATWPPGSAVADDAASSCPPGFVSEEVANAQAERLQMELAESRKEVEMMRTAEAERMATVAAEKDRLQMDLSAAHETVDARNKTIEMCTARLEQKGAEVESLHRELAAANKRIETLSAAADLAEERAAAAEAAVQAARVAAQAAAAQAYEVQPPPQTQEQAPMQPAYQIQPEFEANNQYNEEPPSQEQDAEVGAPDAYSMNGVQDPQPPLMDEANGTAYVPEEMPHDVAEEDGQEDEEYEDEGEEDGGEVDGEDVGFGDEGAPEAGGADESAPTPEEPVKKSWASIAGGLREDKGKLVESKVQGFACAAMGPPPGTRLPPPSAAAGSAAQNSSAGNSRGSNGRGGGGRGGGSSGKGGQDTGTDAAASPTDKGGDAANNDKRRRQRQRPPQRDRPGQQEGERSPQPDGAQPERPDRRRPPRSGKGGKGGKGGSATGSGGRGSGG